MSRDPSVKILGLTDINTRIHQTLYGINVEHRFYGAEPASRKFKQMERDDLRICVVSAYRSSGGKDLLTSNTFIARTYAVSYTFNSFAELICIVLPSDL